MTEDTEEKKKSEFIEYHVQTEKINPIVMEVTIPDRSKDYIVIDNPQTFKGKLKEFFTRIFHPKKGILYGIPLTIGKNMPHEKDWDVPAYQEEMHRRNELSKHYLDLGCDSHD